MAKNQTKKQEKKEHAVIVPLHNNLSGSSVTGKIKPDVKLYITIGGKA